MPFDHEKLDVDRLSLDFVSQVTNLCDGRTIANRFIKGQLSRASRSIPLNIAEGNGKRSFRDRSRFFDIARGSAMECAALLDVLQSLPSGPCSRDEEMKRLLLRIVAMLTRMADPARGRRRGAVVESEPGRL